MRYEEGDCARSAVSRQSEKYSPHTSYMRKEFFVYDLAVGDFVDGDFFHLEPLALRFEGGVDSERHREV